MASLTKTTIFSLSDDVRRSIFEYLLVPGCFEIASPACNGDYTPNSTCITRPGYAREARHERHHCRPRAARLWHVARSDMLGRYSSRSRYLRYQLVRHRIPGTGPHNPRIVDLNAPTLSERGLSQVRKYCTCSCGGCDWRPSRPFTIHRRKDFFSPLLICKALYLEMRTMVFAENVFSFRTPLDLAWFLDRLES
jgi:hypothetical protein